LLTYTSFLWSHSLFPILSALIFVSGWMKLTQSTKCIASLKPSVASADLRCVTYRSKMKLAPVRPLSVYLTKRIMTYFFIRCHDSRKLFPRQEHGNSCRKYSSTSPASILLTAVAEPSSLPSHNEHY